MGKTKIPYAEHNWETVGGCEKIRSGCKNCYAVNLVNRFTHNPIFQDRYDGLVKDGNWTGKIKLFDDRMEQPLRRYIPTTYFVNSRSDLWHKDVPFKFIGKMFAVMAMCPQHKFLLFTKRWERYAEFCDRLYLSEEGGEFMAEAIEEIGGDPDAIDSAIAPPMDNVHLYFSASTQAEVDEAVPILLEIPVAVHGLSYEPALGPLDISEFESEYRNQIDSIIVGCESGPKRRPCKLEWIESIARQCKSAGVPCYVKQIPIDGKCVTLNEKTESIWPAWAVREMPK